MDRKRSLKSVFKSIYIPIKKAIRWYKRMKKPFRLITIGLCLFVFFDICLCVYLFNNGSTTPVKLEDSISSSASELIALDQGSHRGVIKETSFASFKFSNSQKKLFEENFKATGNSALVVRIKVLPTKAQKQQLYNKEDLPLQFGFLTDDDFTARDRFIKPVYNGGSRLVVQGNLREAPEVFDISIALKKDDLKNGILPKGFFVYSTIRCRIVAACVTNALIGFDVSSEIPFYGFAYSGGKIDFSNGSFNFTGADSVFSLQSNAWTPNAEFTVGLYNESKYKSNLQEKVIVELNFSGEKLYLNNVPQTNRIVIPAGAMTSPFGFVTLTANKICVSSLLLSNARDFSDKRSLIEKNDINIRQNEVLIPIKTDPGLILEYKQENWRNVDYELYEWDRFSKILFFDIRTLDLQGRFFTRLAYFVEKEGFKGKLLTNDQIGDKHGYNAHDYSAKSMADFFNKATDLNFRLNDEEELLKKILIANGLFEYNGKYVKANEGGIVSISRETPKWSRVNLLAHEGWHTIFFRDEEFRNFVAAIYGTIDYNSLQFLMDYFVSQPGLGYDINDEYLMHNEFMAYIMQQRLSEVANYFVHVANRGTVIAATPNLAAYIRENKAVAFEDAATMLNDFVFDKYGIVCGDISLISR